MRMLAFVAVAGLVLAGCDQEIEKAVSDRAAEPGQGWTMQVVGRDENHVFLVTGPDGRSAAARVVGAGEGALIDEGEARGLMAETQSALAANPPPEKVSIKAPGVSINVAGDEGGAGKDGRGRVAIDVGGVSIHVDGNTDADNGQVRIGGVNADAARKFIDDIEGLTDDQKAQMRARLGL